MRLLCTLALLVGLGPVSVGPVPKLRVEAR
jgi:hypothetical protein